MTGFILGFLLVLLHGGTMHFGRLGAIIDARTLANKEVAYRRTWLRDWHANKHHNPHVSISEYMREHKDDRPVNMPYEKLRSLEKPLFGIAGVCFALEVVILGYGFSTWDRTTHHVGFVLLCLFTVFAAASLLIWCWLILEETILPAYARTDHRYRSPLPPIPKG